MPELKNANTDKIYIGSNNKIKEWEQNPESKIRALLKNYLELDNVSFLFGAGSSINLGSISIAGIPPQIIKAIFESKTEKDNDNDKKEGVLFTEFKKILSYLKPEIKIEKEGWVDYPVV